jgi:lysozyme family protein
LQRRKIRTRRRDLGAALAAALCLAGCGSGAERHAAPQPRLQRQLAAALAERSDGVAQALAAGRSCEALRLAEELQRQMIAAINAGRVPAPLQEPLQDRVNDLARRIQCTATPPPADEHGKGKGEGKGKKKHGKGAD